MSLFYRKDIAWITLFFFIFCFFPVVGGFNPDLAFAYDAPPKDQGHTGSDGEKPKPQNPPPDPCAGQGSPIHIQSGNHFYSHEDLHIPAGTRLALNITRHYHSQNAYEGPFGYGWSFNLLMELIISTEDDTENVTIRKGDGIRLQYKKNEDGSFTPPTGRYDTLVQNQDGSYDLMKGAGGCSSCNDQFHFDAAGKLIYKKDGNGNQLTYSYDGTGKVTTITDHYNRQLVFTYGTNNKISQISAPGTRIFTYSYDAQNNLVSYTDPLGNTTSYSYDADHNLSSITDPLGNVVNSMAYDDRDRIVTYTEKAETWTISYYPDDNRTSKRDSTGNTYQFYFNDTGQKIQERNPDGKNVYYTWDANYNLTSARDGRGYTTTYTHDALGHRLTETDPLGNTTTYTYDANTGKTASITDPLGRVTGFEYGAGGNTTKITRDAGGSLQNEIKFSYDSHGNLTALTDPLGKTSSFSYDAFNNLTQITDPLGNITSYTYDNLGNRLTETDAGNNTTTFSYDLLNRISSVKDALNNSTTLSYDAGGNLNAVTNAVGNTTSLAYDTYNQLVSITDPLSNATQYTYDKHGNRTSVIDGNGNTTTYTYNRIDQLTGETNALDHNTAYRYDANNNLLTVTDANGNITTNSYDALNRLTTTRYPGGASESFTYDAVGNLVGTTDRNTNTIAYTYDTLNRLTLKTFPDATTTTYSYDLNNNITAAENADISYTFTYDDANRVTGVTNTTLGKTVSYSYLCCGLKNSMTNPEGGVTSYSYDALQRMVSLTNSYGELTAYTYDNLSRITKKTLANGSYSDYSHDAAGRLLNLVNKTSTNSTLSSYTSTYDSIGARTSITDLTGSHNYTYDTVSQLLQATHPASSTETYTYDPVHNRLTSTDHNNWTYDNNNRLISYGNLTYSYDNNGNMTGRTDTGSSEVTSYQYDFKNRLKRINFANNTYSEYRYDPFGNRITKDVNGTVTWFVYDLMKTLPDVIAEYDETGSLIAHYTHGQLVDEVISMRRGGNSYYYFTNGLGSITSMSDSDESTVNSYKYDVFGNVISKTESVVNFYGYTGRVLDDESGLMYYRARYYDPGVGRFISADPIGFYGGINFYTYVQNDPVNWVDPLGLTASCPSSPPTSGGNWEEYHGDSSVFHCGFSCFHENRDPCPDDPIAECCYDSKRNLVDEKHKYSGCRGTPNQYSSSDWYNHAIRDSGGIAEHGIEGYTESRRYKHDQRIKKIRELTESLQKQINWRTNKIMEKVYIKR